MKERIHRTTKVGCGNARTFELLIEAPAACNTQSTDELLEIDRAILVLVEDIEDIVRKLVRIAEREELLVYPAELGLVELA